MSDFDKEAERRRLREKYDEDEPRRQETARMSELLLKGATMTNRHCDNCGAPIFRYDGQEFCPNCQGGGAADAESAEASGGAEADAESAEAAAPDRPADGEAAAPSQNGSDVDREAVTATRASDSNSSADAAERSRASQSTSSGSSPASSASASSSVSPPAATGESSTGATATDARDALLRAVTTHATRGETADDPRRAREHLAAAREAAEALSALDR